MTIKKYFLFYFAFLSALICYSQAPNQFNYQAVLRNSTGAILTNQAVSLKFSILSGSATGSVVYSETHNITTTASGQVNRMIGSGTVLSGTIADVNWRSGTYYLKVELDPAGGTSYQALGTSQFLSTPYTLYSNQVGGLVLSGQNISLGNYTATNSIYWNSNTFIGDHSGYALNGGYYNTFVGESSGRSITSGTSNSFFGTSTGRSTTIGSNNSFYGRGSGNANTSGAGNTFVGTSSGAFNTTADENTFLGYNSGSKNATGYRNTFLGAQAGLNNINGSGNVFIGYKAGINELQSNKFLLANNFDSSNVLIQGDFVSGKVSIKGLLETKSGGLKFPDATIQTSAAHDNQILSLNGDTLTISNGNSIILPSDETLDEDTDPANELQTLSLIGPTLSISYGNSVNLSELPGDNLGNHIATEDITIPVKRGLVSPNGAKIVNGWAEGAGGTWWILPGVAGANRLGVLAQGTAPDSIIIRTSNNPFVINDNGFVGIGTTQPNQILQIIEPANLDKNTIEIAESGIGNGIVVTEASQGTGIVINETGPGSGLVINDSDGSNAAGGITEASIRIDHSGSGNTIKITHSGSDNVIWANSGAVLTNAGAWTDASDSTKKFNIKPLDYGLKTVMTLKPVRYNWKIDSTAAIGFIAQETKKIIPEVVFGAEGNMSMAYDHMVAVLVKAIQQQQAQIETLQHKNSDLEGRLDTMNHLATEILTLKQKMERLDQLLLNETNPKTTTLKTAVR